MDLFEYYGFRPEQERIVAIIPDKPRDASFLAGKSSQSLENFKKQILRQIGLGKSPKGGIFGDAGTGKTHCLHNLKNFFLNDDRVKNQNGQREFEPVYFRLSAWEEKKKIFNQLFHNLIGSLEPNLLVEIAQKFDNLSRSKGSNVRDNIMNECKDMCQENNILQSMGRALDKLSIEASVHKGKDWFLGKLSKEDLRSMEGATIISDARDCTVVLRALNKLLSITHGRRFVFLLDEGQQFKTDKIRLAEEESLVFDNFKALLDDPHIGMILSMLTPPDQAALGSLENSFFREPTIKRRLGLESEGQSSLVDLNLEMNDADSIKDFICGDGTDTQPGILQHWIDPKEAKKIIDGKKLKDTSVRFFPYDENFVDTLVERSLEHPDAKKASRIIDIMGETMFEAYTDSKTYGLPIGAEILDNLNLPSR